jgi:PAS domain S-box-containing protein
MNDARQLEIESLRRRLEEAEETINAIRDGAVDAFVVNGSGKKQVYTLVSADRPYRLLIESMRQGAATIDAAGVIVYGNQALADLLQVPHARLIGTKLRDLISKFDRYLIESLFDPQGKPIDSIEANLQRVDGRQLPALLTFNELPEDCGAALGVSITDLTTQKQNEQLTASHEVLQRMRLLWEAAEILLANDDPDTMLRVVYAKICPLLELDMFFNFMVNDAGTALRLASCVGISSEAQLSIQQIEFNQAICGRVAASRRPIVESFLQRSKASHTQLARSFGARAYACNPLIAGNRLLGTLSFASRTKDQFAADEIDFMQTICQYVSAAYERLRLIKQLREGDRRKDEFLATLAHELRNPLAPIRTGLELMKLASDDASIVEETRTIMEQQLTQLVRLVDDLMDVSRISRGKIELRNEPIELSTIIKSAVETSRPHIVSMQHALTIQLPETPVIVEGDATRLAQVFSNILNNASKYTDRGGKIALSVMTRSGNVEVTIKDNGIGVPAEKLAGLFEMFSQVEDSLSRSQGGLGIGLALVKRLVDMHGGTITAYSDGLGKGSSFIVTLPLANEVSATTHATESVESIPPIYYRILIVDDNRDGANTLAMMMKHLGNEVHTVYDGEMAVKAAIEFEPDVILLDIGLPKMNGYEVCRQIRLQDHKQRIMIIAQTGWGQQQDRQRTQEAGFDHHLVKPIDPQQLMTLLAGIGT